MPETELKVRHDLPEPEMGMMQWLATEGGRKCPQCRRYAKREELGNLSFNFGDGDIRGRVSMYGHKPRTGCRKAKGGE